MKKIYWGFNWMVTPWTGQFGLFILTKKGYRYFGGGPLSLLFLFFWLIFAKEDSKFINYQEEKNFNL